MPDLIDAFRGLPGLTLAHDALNALGARLIPTHPANYEIWITHLTGANPDLSREIEAHAAQGGIFSDAFNEQLFDRFFANTRLSVGMVEAGESIARELADVITTLRDASAQTGNYGATLQTAVDSLDERLDHSGLRTVVAQLAAATRDMARQNHQLLEQMETSSHQVETLQAALQSVKVEALTDSLTGLANRKMFDETLRRRIEECAVAGPLCLILGDIDHFKRVNDTWGHLVGDQVIRFVAHVLKQHARGDFTAARYGGEEFALILPRTDLAASYAIAASVHHQVRSRKITRKSTGDDLGVITISLGVANYRHGENMSDLIGRADACLYASKRAGRDRITTDADSERLSA